MKAQLEPTSIKLSIIILATVIVALFLGTAAASASYAHAEVAGLLRSPLSSLPAVSETLIPPPWNPSLSFRAMPFAEPVAADAMQRIGANYVRIPLRFEPNVGQSTEGVRYLAHGARYTLFLTAQEALMVLHPGRGHSADHARQPFPDPNHPQATASRDVDDSKRAAKGAVVRIRLEGATRTVKPEIIGLERQQGTSNYFRGNDPARWQRDVPHYARVRYADVYPGIDWVFYGDPEKLEYDFVVAPGTDPGQIRLSFQGIDRLHIDGAGNLMLAVTGGKIIQLAPRIYQDVNGERRVIKGSYQLVSATEALPNHATDVTTSLVARNAADAEIPQVFFEVGDYDAAKPLVIDPVLVYSTYLGGSSWDIATGVAVDDSGNVYVTGQTGSPDFPTHTTFYPDQISDVTDGFVLKLNPTGDAVIYSTYFGSTDEEAE